MTNSFDDLVESDCLLIVGSNTTVAHPMVGMRVMECKRRGGKLIVADPRRTELAAMADIHLPLSPGSDVALINGLMHIILKQGWQNQTFIEQRTENFALLRDCVEAWTPEKTAQVTGIAYEDLLHTAELYARSAASAIIYCLGITQHRCGVNNVRSLANLAMLCGQVGRPHTGVNPLRGQNNVQGACDMGGLPEYYPGYQRVDDPEVRHKFEEAWGTSLPAERGLTALEMMQGLHSGRLKGMIIMGENPVMSDPDSGHVREALAAADFVLCIDIFPTPTTELAHLVLPGASFAETDGTFTNSERRVQRVRQAIQPVAGRSNSRIIQELSDKLGYSMSFKKPEAIFDELCALTPSMAGMSYARLDRQGLCWPCPHKEHPGTEILHQESFANGKGQFCAIDYLPPAELPNEEYPFLLNTGMRPMHYLTGTMTRRCSLLERELPECLVDMHPDDARQLGVRERGKVRLRSRRASIVSRVHITDTVPQGMIFAPLHFSEAAINLLTNAACDQESKTPEYKICAIAIEKV